MPRISVAGPSNVEEGPSAGISSSTFGSRPDKSGPSGTPAHPSPVPSAENPSGRDPQASQAPSSSASSTDGPTQETGSSPARQPGSSAGFRLPTPATPDQAPSSAEDEPPADPAHATEPVEGSSEGDDPTVGLSEAEKAAEAHQLLASAHEAFEQQDYDLAEGLLGQAEDVWPEIRSETAQPHAAIQAKKAEGR